MIQFTLHPLATDFKVLEYLMKSTTDHTGQILTKTEFP